MSTLAATFGQIVTTLRDRDCRPRARRGGQSVRAKCPVHEDTNPSFVVTHKPGRIVFRCFGGCRQGELLKALDLRYSDLFEGAVAPPRTLRAIIATYDYSSTVQKCRTAPKGFYWRHRDGGEWRSGFPAGFVPTLYRLRNPGGRVVHEGSHNHIVVVEGERAVERLFSLGIPATCPPAGASSWPDHLTADLLSTGCTTITVLADNDQGGRTHAERVAGACYHGCQSTDASQGNVAGSAESGVLFQTTDPPFGMKLTIRVVHLPDLPTGGDVVDYLDAGHSAADLLAIIEEAPAWYPGCEDARRQERRRQLARVRSSRRRQRRRAERDNKPTVVIQGPANKPIATEPAASFWTAYHIGVTNAVTSGVTDASTSATVTRHAPNVINETTEARHAPNVTERVTQSRVTHPERSSLTLHGPSERSASRWRDPWAPPFPQPPGRREAIAIVAAKYGHAS